MRERRAPHVVALHSNLIDAGKGVVAAKRAARVGDWERADAEAWDAMCRLKEASSLATNLSRGINGTEETTS